MLCTTVIVIAYLWYSFLHTPMYISTREELVINRGTTIGHIAHELETRNIIKSARLLRYLAWHRGDANKIKAGEYLLEPNLTPITFLQKIVDGRVIQYSFTIIDGWKFSQVLNALHNQAKIVNTLNGCGFEKIAEKLKQNTITSSIEGNKDNVISNLEGMFWPDTYFYTAGTTDLELLLRAYKIMQVRLQQEWENRDTSIQLKDAKEALILASILEKETSIQNEYYMISGVFHKRLQMNMSLQADPTVIYALSQNADFKMPITKADLNIDSPYNTYKYPGLPPTPIAIPSFQALHAALHPSNGAALYFVANGKGGHVFSMTLQEHNKAVMEYRAKVLQEQNPKDIL